MEFLSSPLAVTGDSLVEYSEHWLSNDEALMLVGIAKKDPVHAIAGRMLRNALFSEDLQAKILNQELKNSSPVKDLELYFRLFYESLGHLAQADCHALGYTVWTYSEILDERLSDDRAVVIPVHVYRDRYDVKARIYKDERVELIPVKRGAINPTGNNFHIFVWPGMEPNPTTGEHNSTVSSLVGEFRKIVRLKEMEERANHQRSHPPYVLEPAVSAGSGSTTDLMIHTTTTPFGQKNAAQSQQQKLVMAINEQTLAASLRPALGVVRDDNGERRVVKGPQSTFDDNKHYIPHGYKAASSQPALPEVPANVLDYDLSYNKLVFASYGIPFSLALGDGKTASSGGAKQTANLGGERDLEMFQKSLLQATKSLENLYAEMWHCSFPGNTCREDVRFILRRVPFTSSGALHGLYNQGIIHESSLKKRLAQVHGLAEDDIATEPNVITRPPMHGTESHTTAQMDAKVEALKADAAESRAKAAALKRDSNEGEDSKDLIKLQIEFEKEKAKILIETLKAKLEYEKESLATKLRYEKQKPAPKKAKTTS